MNLACEHAIVDPFCTFPDFCFIQFIYYSVICSSHLCNVVDMRSASHQHSSPRSSISILRHSKPYV